MSSTPVTVTVWGVLQVAPVKVRLAGDTVPSAGLLLESPMITSAVGCCVSTTSKVADPPLSLVTRPDAGDTEIRGRFPPNCNL